MNVGPFQILIIALVLLVLFGRGRVSETMGDLGKGVQNFRKGIANDVSSSVEGAGRDGLSETELAGEAAEPAPDPIST